MTFRLSLLRRAPRYISRMHVRVFGRYYLIGGHALP